MLHKVVLKPEGVIWEIVRAYKGVVCSGLKKLNLRGVGQPLGIALRRKPSHTGRENPRIPAPPIQWHCSPCENDNDRGRAIDLCFGVGQTRGFVLTPAWKFAPTRSRTRTWGVLFKPSNPTQLEVLSLCLHSEPVHVPYCISLNLSNHVIIHILVFVFGYALMFMMDR